MKWKKRADVFTAVPSYADLHDKLTFMSGIL
jgi:hypothetical protein